MSPLHAFLAESSLSLLPPCQAWAPMSSSCITQDMAFRSPPKGVPRRQPWHWQMVYIHVPCPHGTLMYFVPIHSAYALSKKPASSPQPPWYARNDISTLDPQRLPFHGGLSGREETLWVSHTVCVAEVCTGYMDNWEPRVF